MKFLFLQNKLLVIFLFFIAYPSFSQDKQLVEISVKKNLMGTEFTLTAMHPFVDSCKRAILNAFREIERIENFTSNYKPETEISKVNKNAFYSPVKISNELFQLLKRSIEYSEKYNGLFDVTVGALTEYYGLNSDHPISSDPRSSTIDSLLKFVGYKYILLDDDNLTVSFLNKGLQIDLGGIAKGYAIDEAAKILKKFNVNDFLLSGGGDMIASGHKSDGSKWRIGIKNPRKNDEVLETVELSDNAIATSGDYERYVIINGIRYHHIINPLTGYPPLNTQSSSVIVDNCEEGVVLSKVLFIMSKENIDSVFSCPYYYISENGNKYFNQEFIKYKPY